MNFNISGYSYELDQLNDDELIVLLLYKQLINEYIPISLWIRIDEIINK